MSNIIDFKMLEAKPVGSDTVVFELEDGAKVKVKVDIQRAGVATNFTNPDGTPYYSITIGTPATVIPPEKKFAIPRSELTLPTTKPKKDSAIKPV